MSTEELKYSVKNSVANDICARIGESFNHHQISRFDFKSTDVIANKNDIE